MGRKPQTALRQFCRCAASLLFVASAASASAFAGPWHRNPHGTYGFGSQGSQVHQVHPPAFRGTGPTVPLRAESDDSAPVDVERVERSRPVQLWGVLGVAAYLSYGLKKVVPIVTAGMSAMTSPFQWILLAGTLGFFAYVEGYKGFQLSFCPRVVSRAWVVSETFTLSPKNLLKRYGFAYLFSSITLSICSYTLFYELVKRDMDVEGFLSNLGISIPQSKYYGAAALAYALHKAASPIRFPPTLLLTQLFGKLMGKQVSPEDERATRALWHKLFAPAFCIGYFHGTRARVTTSWAVTITIFFVVIAVRHLANPYRAIIDAGVIVGLLWGTVSVLLLYLRSLREGRAPDFDPSLPEDTPYRR